MKSLTFLGRIIYAIPFIIFGVFHFLNARGMADSMLSNWPFNMALVYISGLGLILAGVSIMLNLYARVASLLLALLLLIIILTIHLKGVISVDAVIKQMATTSLLKDVALLGAALTYAGLAEK